LPNVFKSQSVLLDHKKPYIPENRTQCSSNENIANIPEGTARLHSAEEIVQTRLRNSEIEANVIITRAKLEAEKMLTQSKVQSDNIKEEARLYGYEQGFDQGIESAGKKCASTIEEILSIRQQIIDERAKLFTEFEKDLVKLSLEISKKVIFEQLSEDDEAFLRLVQSTVQKVRGVDFVKCWVSPVDFAKLAKVNSSLISDLKGIKDIEVLKGDSIKRWGCIVDTESGVLDGSVDTRIAQVEEELNSTVMGLSV